jgi:hypothetical protein
MKLAKVTSNDPVQRLAVSVRKSTNEQIDAYRDYYKSVYGDEIERSHLVEEMLRGFMSTDKEFVKYLESLKKSGKQPAASHN